MLITLLALGSSANAQAPTISEVSTEISEPARTRLTRQRAGLLEQRDSIAAKVRAHNDRCSDIPAGAAAEKGCEAAQKQLNGVITEYRAKVEAFNTAVASAPRAKP